MTSPAVPEIFDADRLALRRERARRSGDGFLAELVLGAVVERLDDVTRRFESGLLVDRSPDEADALSDRLGFRLKAIDATDLFGDRETGGAPRDCILWPGGLESLADIPGALIRCRRLLRPDGMIMGAFWGAGSLPALRRVMAVADGESPRVRLHPQVDVRAMGDLLQRAGIALPVIDRDDIDLRYRSFDRLIADLRGSGLTNVLAGPVAALDRNALARAKAAFEAARDETGQVVETMTLVHFTGWAPDVSQPVPARRGSAKVSLRDALSSKP